MSIAAPILVNNFFLNFLPAALAMATGRNDVPLPLDLFDGFR